MQFCPDQVNRLRIGQAPFFRGIQKRFPYIALAERNESLNPADKFQNQFCSDQMILLWRSARIFWATIPDISGE